MTIDDQNAARVTDNGGSGARVSDKCPWCGAAETHNYDIRRGWKCESYQCGQSRRQSDRCAERVAAQSRIAELAAELSRLRDNPRTNDTCHKCKTSIRANDATVTECGRKYHALCKVADRAEAAERERDTLRDELAGLRSRQGADE